MGSPTAGGRGSNQYQRRGASLSRMTGERRKSIRQSILDHLDDVDCSDRDLPIGVRVAAWLRRLPPNTGLTWGQDHAHTTRGDALTAWVDVQIPEVEKACHLTLVWTITGADDPVRNPRPEDGDMIVPYDMDVYGGIDPDTHWYGYQTAVPAGTPLPVSEELELLRYEERHVDHGWSIPQIGNAIQEWTATYAGRPDITFQYDPELLSAAARADQQIAARAKAGKIDLYELGDGFMVSERVMDRMLELNPDSAANLVGSAKRALQESRLTLDPSE